MIGNTIYLDEIPEWSNDVPAEKINPNEKWIKHVHCEGARFHVFSYIGLGGFGRKGKSIVRCSEPNCIVNKIADEEEKEYKENWLKYL